MFSIKDLNVFDDDLHLGYINGEKKTVRVVLREEFRTKFSKSYLRKLCTYVKNHTMRIRCIISFK